MTSPFLIRRSSEPLFLQSDRALYLPGHYKVVLENYVIDLIAKMLAQLHAVRYKEVTCYFNGKCSR